MSYRHIVVENRGDASAPLLVRHTNGVLIGECLMTEDGYYHFEFDRSRGGYVSQWILEEVVDLLRELNREWDAIVRDECGPPIVQALTKG